MTNRPASSQRAVFAVAAVVAREMLGELHRGVVIITQGQRRFLVSRVSKGLTTHRCTSLLSDRNLKIYVRDV